MIDANQYEFLKSLPEFPIRDPQGHKGSYGLSVLIGGSRGMSGAISMAGRAALIAGSGLVRLLIPEKILDIVALYAPEYMTVPMTNDEQGKILEKADRLLTLYFEKATAAAIGPGLGKSEDLNLMIRGLFDQCPIPLVIDADALASLGSDFQCDSSDQTEKKVPRILTPHPGEFVRLTGHSLSNDSKDRQKAALSFIRDFRLRTHSNVILVLKGHETVITDGEQIFVNQTGNPGMATGGSGDVLTGLIVGLLAQKLHPLNAVRLAVALHGLSGDLAANDLPYESMLATDLIRYFPQALNFFRNHCCSHCSSLVNHGRD